MNIKLPHEIKSEETKQKILTATEQMLAEYDFKYLTVRNICERGGVAYGSFYHHFSSKENLLFTYVKNLYRKNQEANPVPDWIAPEDYVKNVLWYVEVLGCFCETAGRDLMGYVYKNCPQGIFEDTMRGEIASLLRTADANGCIDQFRSKNGRISVELLRKDLEILCDGTILWWSCSEDEIEPLHETLEHLCFNMLFSFASEAYRNKGYPQKLLTEMEQFHGAIVIHGVPGQKE